MWSSGELPRGPRVPPTGATLLPPGECRTLWEKKTTHGEPQRWGDPISVFSPPSAGGMQGERRSSWGRWSPKMLNKWAGVFSPKRERAAIGCRCPPVPMGARWDIGYPQHKQIYTAGTGSGEQAKVCKGRRGGREGGFCSSHMATPRTDLVRELRRGPSAARAHCAFRKKQH